ncbi:uncharacterized protein LOC127079990 [Lathyrus oleraceus]|uniref:uncharacterized protein LOC127079990 n=1 Tax=Pisum sativum TaxID=3888 RepID=UPI0021D165AC|nr:uncharacterized protein LOC127079990 [Pisum sativum]
MIQEKMKASQRKHKIYHDKRRKTLECQEEDHMFFRVTLVTGISRAVKSLKLTPRFIGPYQILQRVRVVAYRVALPPPLSNLYDVFHMSQLYKYILDPSHVIQLDDVQVVWGGPDGGSVMWELESKIKGSYPEIFPSGLELDLGVYDTLELNLKSFDII